MREIARDLEPGGHVTCTQTNVSKLQLSDSEDHTTGGAEVLAWDTGWDRVLTAGPAAPAASPTSCGHQPPANPRDLCTSLLSLVWGASPAPPLIPSCPSRSPSVWLSLRQPPLLAHVHFLHLSTGPTRGVGIHGKARRPSADVLRRNSPSTLKLTSAHSAWSRPFTRHTQTLPFC